MSSKADPPDSAAGGGGRSPEPPRGGGSNCAIFAEVFDRWHKRLVNHLVRRGAQRSEAEEIVGEAFEKVLARKNPRSVSFLAAYLFTTARNIASNRLQHRAVQQRTHPLIRAGASDEDLSPEALLMASERAELLQRVIMELPVSVRTALTLRVWDELTYPQIVARFAAMGTDIAERTVRRYVAIGLKHCQRKILAAEAPGREERK